MLMVVHREQTMFITRRVCCVGLITLAAVPAAQAAPKADLWPRWQTHTTGSTLKVDHSAWAQLLTKYRSIGSDQVARFAYGKVFPADKAALKAYLAALQTTDVDALDRDEQYAYWLNFYNALTVDVVLDHWPVRSIKDIDISPGLFSSGPWGKKLVTVAGEELSLDDIEHRILRPIWRDPRIHYGVNCASIGCPNLLAEPFTGTNVNIALQNAAMGYINHPRGATIMNGELVVSSIYRWFQEDFGGNDRGVIRHMLQYAAPKLAYEVQRFDEIDEDRYDWVINAA